MIWASAGLGISMIMVSILLSFVGTSVEHATTSAAVAFFFTYMLIFGASVDCIPWCYVSEILPLHARAKGTPIGTSSNWLWNFFAVMITPILLNRLAWKGYLVFTCTSFAFIPLVCFCHPEPANLTLEDIGYIFEDGNKGAVKWSLKMRKERIKSGRQDSFVRVGRRDSSADAAYGTLKGSRDETDALMKKEDSSGIGVLEHSERV